MRVIAGGGLLLALLIGVAIMLYLSGENATQVNNTRKQIEPEAQRISGRGSDGVPVGKSYAVTPQPGPGGTARSFTVDSVVPGGAMDEHFGLRTGDRITLIDGQKFDTYGDSDIAKAMIDEAPQRRKSLTVVRGGRTFVLPAQKAAAALVPLAAAVPTGAVPAANAPSPAVPAPVVSNPPVQNPAAPAPKPEDGRSDPLGRQLEGIRRQAENR